MAGSLALSWASGKGNRKTGDRRPPGCERQAPGKDAVQAYRLQKGGIGLGAKLGGGGRIEEKKGFYQWGDESYFADILGEKGPAGNIFGTRLGKKTYWIMIAGLYFEERSDWAEFIEPKLRYLETYNP